MNWLFFGDQHEASDYLYRAEIEAMKESGVLTRLDLAWSRDGVDKVYVQHRMLARSAEIWQWLQDGAAIFICGDAQRMAKDVECALLGIIETEGGMSADAAQEFLSGLKQQRRYQRDVY